jgi:hypothetical protein
MRVPTLLLILCFTFSCSKIDEFLQEPELTPLEDGFKASAAIAYCVSLASRAYTGKSLPSHVVYDQEPRDGYTGSGLIYVDISSAHPLPFNGNTFGDVIISGLWDGQNGGVISILFADVDVLNSKFKFYGLFTIPVYVRPENGEIVAIFAEQDIVIGEGDETILNLSLSKPEFNLELDRLDSDAPSDVFIAVTQNVWHITIDPGNDADLTDDLYEVTGGGQIVSAQSNSGGVLYHAMINTQFSLGCTENPTSGTAFIQNLQAGSIIDLGTILVDFHNECDGNADITLATGKYATSTGSEVQLNWN